MTNEEKVNAAIEKLGKANEIVDAILEEHDTGMAKLMFSKVFKQARAANTAVLATIEVLEDEDEDDEDNMAVAVEALLPAEEVVDSLLEQYKGMSTHAVFQEAKKAGDLITEVLDLLEA